VIDGVIGGAAVGSTDAAAIGGGLGKGSGDSASRSEIDRRSPVPFYFQMAHIINDEIRGGHWPRGERLPSEPTLSDRFDVSRTTVRQALTRLEQAGLIVRIKGRGTFVAAASTSSWLLQSSEGFFHEELDRLGVTVTSRLLRAEVAPLPSWAAEALQQEDGDDGVTIERLRFADGRVALFVTDFLPAHLARSVLDLSEHESLYDRLEEREGLRVAGGRRTIESIKAGAKLATLLEVKPTDALTVIESVAWDDNAWPFHCFSSFVRTDRMRIQVEVSRLSSASIDL
jgi:GntR family transcriptional regulator